MLTGHSLLIKILDWREKHLSEKTFVFLLATAVGLPVSFTHLRAHETGGKIGMRLFVVKKKE